MIKFGNPTFVLDTMAPLTLIVKARKPIQDVRKKAVNALAAALKSMSSLNSYNPFVEQHRNFKEVATSVFAKGFAYQDLISKGHVFLKDIKTLKSVY